MKKSMDILNRREYEVMFGKKYKIAIVIILFLVLGGVGISLSGRRTLAATIAVYVEAYMEGNGKKLVSLFPDKLMDAIYSHESYLNETKIVEEIDDTLEILIEKYEENGIDYDYLYQIIEAENYSAKDVRKLQIDYLNEYNVELDIEEAKKVEIEITIIKDWITYNPDTIWVDAIKIGDTWYIKPGSL